MLTNSSGHLTVTVVDGSTLVGIYASDGSMNVFDASGVTTPVGIYHASGAINVTQVDGATLVGLQAPNGSFYIINDSAEIGSRHSSGALNITNFAQAASGPGGIGSPIGLLLTLTQAS